MTETSGFKELCHLTYDAALAVRACRTEYRWLQEGEFEDIKNDVVMSGGGNNPERGFLLFGPVYRIDGAERVCIDQGQWVVLS